MMPSGHKAFVVHNPRDVELLLMHNRTYAAEYVFHELPVRCGLGIIVLLCWCDGPDSIPYSLRSFMLCININMDINITSEHHLANDTNNPRNLEQRN